jgi:DNA-binding response OmpR family regulator
MDWNKFNNLSILVIDDDQFTRELIKTMLKKVPNIEIHEASDGKKALDLTESIRFDMILLDLYMPQMNGKEFILNLKRSSEYEALPIVLISTDRLSSVELYEIGATYYLPKPFDFQNFLVSIYNYLEK